MKKKIILLLSFITLLSYNGKAQVTAGSCGIYYISLYDSWISGWEGGYLDIYVNGSAVLTNVTTIYSQQYIDTVYFAVDINDVVSVDYTIGLHGSENEYIVHDENGFIIASEGVGQSTPNDIGNYFIPTGLVACVTPSWDCNNGVCNDPGTGNGQYATLGACNAVCVMPSWDCNNGVCNDPGTGNGQYATLGACNAVCVMPSWDCNNGVCNDPGTGAGMYTSQASCDNACIVNGVEEQTTNKKLLKITDLLGRETKGFKNDVLFYIYDDGTVQKKIIIE